MKATNINIFYNTLIVTGLLLSYSLLTAQVRISSTLPLSGRGGEFIKNHAGPNSVFFAPPYGKNMHQTYFSICLENVKPGILDIMVQYEATFKVPAFAAYKFDDGEWDYTPEIDTAKYQIEVPSGVKKVYFASGIPFSYGDLLSYIEDLPASMVDVIDLQRRSVEGRSVKVLKITDQNEPDDYKQLVWVLSGQHPYELPGIHTAVNIVDFLISDDPFAVNLRKNTLFYICPIVDVDASDNGLSGKRKVGRGTKSYPLQDFNWDWNVELNSSKPIQNTQGGPNAYNNISHPQVKSLQELIYQTSMKNPLRFFWDSHSPWPDKMINDTSALHVIDKYLPRSSRSYRNAKSPARQFWDTYESVMGFKPVVLTDEWPSFVSSASGKQKHSFSYGPDEQYDYERSADYWVDSENALFYRNTMAHPNIFFSATLETGWHYTPINKDGERAFWTLDMLAKHARALCVSMANLMSSFEIDHKGDIIIDINPDNKQLEFKGDWKPLTGMLPNTPMHYHEQSAMTTSEEGAYVRIPLLIHHSGVYDLYNWHNPIVYAAFEPKPNHILNDENVQYLIFNGEEYFQLTFDQTQVGGAWQKLTSLYIHKDKKAPYIEIKKISKNQKIAQVDAIRLSPTLHVKDATFRVK